MRRELRVWIDEVIRNNNIWNLQDAAMRLFMSFSFVRWPKGAQRGRGGRKRKFLQMVEELSHHPFMFMELRYFCPFFGISQLVFCLFMIGDYLCVKLLICSVLEIYVFFPSGSLSFFVFIVKELSFECKGFIFNFLFLGSGCMCLHMGFVSSS